MRLYYNEDRQSLINSENGFTQEYIEDRLKTILMAIQKVAPTYKKNIKEKYNQDVNIVFSRDLVYQIVLDAVEDLRRLIDYHPIKEPNIIKVVAYTSFWWLKRKPVYVLDNLATLTKISMDDRRALLHINEHIIAAYIMSSVFSHNEIECQCKDHIETYEKEWHEAYRFLVYYLIYRAESPKSIEAFIVGSTLHPIYKEKGSFWLTNDETV